jgi:CubicO group peptidase (beta-lactamase class C family)
MSTQKINASMVFLTALAILPGSHRGNLRAADPTSTLPRSTPESQGISSAAILDFVEEADKKIDHLHSFMLVRHGKVVAEGWWGPYDAHTRHELYSLSKSFTSTAVGLAIADGKLSLDDPVLKFFPEEAPAEPSENLKAMRLRDLLCMGTGHETEPRVQASKESWVKTFLAAPVPHKPGTHFLYNTAATYMQSAIVQKVTGQTVLDYLRPRLFEPLGIANPTWGTSPQGISLGGYGLNVRTEDIAKFGQLYLQHGKWHGKQLVPSEWVEMATSKQISNGSNPKSDWNQGYGYQFWRSRNNCYRGDGAFGQYCIVMPDQDAVVAITSGVRDMQAVLNLVWDKLLPAMKPDSLPSDDVGDQKLKSKLASLTMPTPKSSESHQIPSDVSGKTFHFPSNPGKLEMLSLEFHQVDPVTLIMKCDGTKECRVHCGNGEWKKGRLAFGSLGFGPLQEQPAAVCGAWAADKKYTALICFYETPYVLTLEMDFSSDKIRVDPTWNVSFGPRKPGQLVGERK